VVWILRAATCMDIVVLRGKATIGMEAGDMPQRKGTLPARGYVAPVSALDHLEDDDPAGAGDDEEEIDDEIEVDEGQWAGPAAENRDERSGSDDGGNGGSETGELALHL
jgi:hypothetical protein